MAIVQSLAAIHYAGQTHVYAGRNSITGPFSVYCHTAQITSGNIGGLTPIATIDQYSGALRYSDAPGSVTGGANLSAGLIIPDGAGGTITLGSSYIHLCWTPSSSATRYYAITHSGDTTVTVGTNSLTSGVVETAVAVPGAVCIAATTNYLGLGRTARRYMAWEDHATWRHSEWGYYGHRFDVLIPSTGSAPYPLNVWCHPAGLSYREPIIPAASWNTNEVVLAAADLGWNGGADVDPYTSTAYGHSKWTGRTRSDSGLYITCTQARVIRYLRLLSTNATGDGYDFGIDTNRRYIYGASLGSGAMHIASHYGSLFAACGAGIGWITDDAYNGALDDTVKVDAADGPTIAQYNSMIVQSQAGPLIPIIHAMTQNDSTIRPDNYPEAIAQFETDKQPYVIEWRGQDPGDPHGEFAITSTYSQWDWRRFLKNESYPCFGNASNSDTPEASAAWTSGSLDPNGQRNAKLDWHSSRHSITGGSALSDTTTSYAISLVSASACTADVTIRNQQAFLPSVGEVLTYSTSNGQSGTPTRNSDGSVTITGLSIPTSAMRLTISVVAPASPTNTARLIFARA